MKKLILTSFALIASAGLLHAQGWLQLTSGTAFGITTNTTPFSYQYPALPLGTPPYITYTSGKTFTASVAPGAYDFTYLYIPTGIASGVDSNNLVDGDWIQLSMDVGSPGPALMATNSAGLAGNFAGQSAGNGVQAIGINGDAFINGVTYSVALVGWSANLGSSWGQVSAEYTSDDWINTGFFGYTVGSVNPNGAPTGSSPALMFGNNSLILYTVVPGPEPSTLALTALGGLSMLLLRHRKA